MPPGDVSSQLEELSARVEKLERRICALESPPLSEAAKQEPAALTALAGPGASEIVTGPQWPSAFSVFGRAVLGIAGAYLLRAAAETEILPPWLAMTLALAYAAGWLVLAAWPSGWNLLTRYSYAVTAALILSPLLWEVTVRFRMLEPAASAALVAAFALLAAALAWRLNLSPVFWVGVLAAIVTAFVLMAATREPLPFTAALLPIAGISEFAASRGRCRVLRAFVAAGADLMVLILILILGDVRAIPQDYHPANAGVLIAIVVSLFVIYAAGVASRSLVSRLPVTGFEAAQLATVALLAGWGVLRITQGEAEIAVGVCCFALGAASYFAAFVLRAQEGVRRNFRFYAGCAVIFVMAGSFLALPPGALVIWLCAAAMAASELGVRAHNPALEVHGLMYLSGAAYASGLLEYTGRALAGAYPGAPEWLPILSASTALLCAVIVARYGGEGAGERMLRLLSAILAVGATAGLAVAGIALVVKGRSAPAPAELAVIRSGVTCAAALLLAFFGARFERRELVWMAYAAAVLGSVKLVFEDLRIGSAHSLAASLLIYGAVLILIPRLARAGKPRVGT